MTKCIECGTTLQEPPTFPSVTTWWCPTCQETKEVGR
jgi:formamidopyrimidine-DNA glycosylase